MKEELSRKAEASGQPLELLQQLEKLRESATKDALTGLLNRGTTEEQIKQALQCLTSDETCAMFIIDLDHFKDVNDTLGHQTGDEVLVRAAHIISGLFRPTDIVGRLGGDEFIVFIQGHITRDTVRSKGFSICQQLQLTSGENVQVTVTASVGICMASGPNADFEILYRLADQALYQSKTDGRQTFHIVKNSCEMSADSDALHTVSIPVKLSGILSSIDSGIALMDITPPYQVIYSNLYFRKMTGIGEEAVTGRNLAELIHPEDRSFLQNVLEIRKNDEVFVRNIRVLTDRENYAWIRIHSSVVSYDEGRFAYMISASDISELKEKEKRLESINERLQTAFDQTGQGIWEVDLASGRFRMYDDGFGGAFHKKAVDFPDDLIQTSWVHPDSVSMLRQFAEGIYSGNMSGYGNFILRYPDIGTYQWAALSYTLLHDPSGKPTRAVGIIETLSQDLHGIQSLNYPHRYVPESLVPYLIFHIRADLSEDAVQDVWKEGKYMTGNPEWTTASQIFLGELAKIPVEEERKLFREYFQPSSLIRAYQNGTHWRFIRYQRVDGQGNLQRCCFTTGLYKNLSTGNVCMFSFLYHSEYRYRWERELQLPVMRDPSTFLYQRSTVLSMTQMLLNRHWEGISEPVWEQGDFCASAIITVNGLADLEIGVREQIRFYIARTLNNALGVTQITAQHGQRKFFTFFPSIASKEKLLHKLEHAFEYVRCSLSGIVKTDGFSFIAGVYCTTPDETNADLLLKHAEETCSRWEDSLTDKILFSDEKSITEQNDLYVPDRRDRIWFYKEAHRRPLTEQEKEIRFQCVSEMLLADSLSASMRNLLSLLGRFYKADRIYFLLLSGEDLVANIPCEWDAPGISEIALSFSGQTLETLPLVELCAKEEAPLFLARGTQELQSADEWRYMVLPMPDPHTIRGYLCIENAKNCFSEDVLPYSLIPYIRREYQRYQSVRSINYGSFTPEPHIREYTKEISRFNSDTYSTLGVLCVDIPEFPALNSTLGLEYGRRILRFIIQTATPVFGRNFIFRTWDSEFIILCPNTTEQVFLSKCGRLQRRICERYPEKIRTGMKWSEYEFNGMDMAEQIRSEMRKKLS